MGDDERRPPLHQPLEGAENRRLGPAVEGRRRFVQDQYRGIAQQRPGDRDPLTFATRQRRPAFTDERVVAVGQRADELVGIRGGCGRHDLTA